jgi:putative protease
MSAHTGNANNKPTKTSFMLIIFHSPGELSSELVQRVLSSPRMKPELIAPAGNMECARAAVANGANAVYFGLQQFNARMRADNFTEESLPELVRFLHSHGVRAFCTLNTLIFTDELPAAERELMLLDEAGVDAVLVQDLGIARLAKELGVRMDVHASTQMTITSPEGVAFADRLGIKRVVIARETSLRELAKFSTTGVSLETFVHGALCIAYSGQCLTSEALGQRSANRGECAQACRLPYDLIVDGVLKDLGDRRYLLSPQDLAAVREIPELIKLGVTGFKIEGRLKSPEYVAATCQVYRKAIDAVELSPEDEYKLEMTFSRGLYTGWMHGVNHQQLVHARFGKKRGPFVGPITNVEYDHVEVESQAPLKAGDGVVFDTGGDTDKEQGGRIWEIRGKKLFFERGHIDFTKLKTGDRVWKTSDPKLERELRKSFAGDIPRPKQKLDLTVTGSAGKLLTVEAKGVRVHSSMPLQTAYKRPLNTPTLRDQLGRLGETDFEIGEVTNKIAGQVILPVSELNRLRRELCAKLNVGPEVETRTPLKPVLPTLMPQHVASTGALQLIALCRMLDQIRAALDAGVATIYTDFEDLRRYPEAVALVRGRGTIYLGTPRIQKAGEQGFFKLIEHAQPDGVLIRNLGALDYFRKSPLKKIGDFSLNVANPLSADLLMREGLERVTISYDCNAQQVLDLLKAAPPAWFELVIHQHLPMFHMEHCVFAAFLSTGTDSSNCGRPCDTHNLKLRDRVGIEHPVKADVGCRNTVFHAKAQSGAEFFRQFIEAGAHAFRIELLEEDAAQTRRILQTYQDLLTGKTDGLKQLNAVRQLGVTSGTLTVLG